MTIHPFTNKEHLLKKYVQYKQFERQIVLKDLCEEIHECLSCNVCLPK